MSAMTNNNAYLFIYKSFCLIAPEPNTAKTVIQIVIQKFEICTAKILKFPDFSPKITTVIQTVIQIVIHGFWGSKKILKNFQIGLRSTCIAYLLTRKIKNSENLIAGSCKTVIHIVIQKSP